MSDAANSPAEERARALIDEQLRVAGWVVQDQRDMAVPRLGGAAIREMVMAPGHGRVDYLLYVDRQVVGVIEAKPVGHSLSGVEFQSNTYAQGLPEALRPRARTTTDGHLPFVFEANGVEVHFTNGYDPVPRARRVFSFPKPEALAQWVRAAAQRPEAPTWRASVREMPPLQTELLRPAQITAIEGIENSLAEQRFDRSLVQMATGAGKTYTAVTECYRLLKHGGFKRVLFLVDRNNLADQTMGEFENYRTPDEGRRFTELYPVQKLTSGDVLASSNVVISTIQRVYRVLNDDVAPEGDDPQLDGWVPDTPVTVNYSSKLPPEAFDLVIVDEAHRSIYGVWRDVLEYFDAHVIGLTATPGKQTFAFFRQNLVSEYTYPQSVADGVNVDFDIYRISTEISEQGSQIEAGTIVPKVDRRTREQRLEELDDDLVYTKGQLDRAVTAKSQIRLVLQTFHDRLFSEIFPGRRIVPKTLIFAKDDQHAEEIVSQVREVFGQGNDFAAKITYAARDPKGHLRLFRNSPTLRIAVTVDMIATGTDVRPLECVFFMRDVRSGQYFEQMKGRGSRTVDQATFNAVTPDAANKTRFVLVDAVGVTEHGFVEAPLNRVKGVSLEKLLKNVANLSISEDETATLASQLAKLELDLTEPERQELDEVAGQPLRDVVRGLVDAVNPDNQASRCQGSEDPAAIVREMLDEALDPLVENAPLRERILELRRSHDQVIDEVSKDQLRAAYGVVDPDRARSIVESWRGFLDQHRDEITAIQLMMATQTARVPFSDVQSLADRIARPPHNWTPELLWAAYEQIDAGRVKHSERHTLTDLVSLMRYTLGLDQELVPYSEQVRGRYGNWLMQQEQAGARFTVDQMWWLDNMVEVIVNSAGIDAEALGTAPFDQRGGVDGIIRDLGPRAGDIMSSLNEELTA